MLDSGLSRCVVEPHRRHCIVSLSKTLDPLLSTGCGSTQEDLSRQDYKNVDLDLTNQSKQTKSVFPGVVCFTTPSLQSTHLMGCQNELLKFWEKE